jgi:hypothetical protein
MSRSYVGIRLQAEGSLARFGQTLRGASRFGVGLSAAHLGLPLVERELREVPHTNWSSCRPRFVSRRTEMRLDVHHGGQHESETEVR